MLTSQRAPDRRESKRKQPTGANEPASGEARIHYSVKHHDHGPAPKKPKKALRKGRRQGGWKATQYLDHAQWREAYSDALALSRAGYAFTVLASIMPPDRLVDDAARQRWISKYLADIGQELERRGQFDVRMTVLEKTLGGKLHAHALIHVIPDNLDVIARKFGVFDRSRALALDPETDESVLAHAAEIGSTPDDLLNAILYVLKQHLWAGPGRDGAGSERRFWIPKGDPIKGQRLSRSKAAKAILAATADNAPRAAVAAPRAVPEPVVAQIEQPVQLVLFDAPVIDIRAQIEAARLDRRMTQGQLAVILGMKQPHYSNAVVRRHDPLGPFARRRALEWLKAA